MTIFKISRPWLALLLTLVVWAQAICACERVSASDQEEAKVASTRPRVALALGGGGTRGAAHVGVLRVLEQEGIPIDCIAGTSMGAVVGGLYAAGLPVGAIEEKFIKGSLLRAFLTVPLKVRIAAMPLFAIPHAFGHHPHDGLYKGNKFATYLNTSVPESSKNIEDLKLPFAAVALNLLDGKVYALRKGNLGRCLQASSAVPLLRRPVALPGGLFVDGGVLANLPVKEARAMGASVVIAVDVDERFDVVPESAFHAIGAVGHRVLTLHLSKVDEAQIAAADVVIHPNVNGIGLISTRQSDTRAAIAAGEDAARLCIPLIKEKLKNAGVMVTRADAALIPKHGEL